MSSEPDEWNDPPGVHDDTDDTDTDVDSGAVGLELAACLACGTLLAVSFTHGNMPFAFAGPALVAAVATAWRWAVAYERRGRGGGGA